MLIALLAMLGIGLSVIVALMAAVPGPRSRARTNVSQERSGRSPSRQVSPVPGRPGQGPEPLRGGHGLSQLNTPEPADHAGSEAP